MAGALEVHQRKEEKFLYECPAPGPWRDNFVTLNIHHSGQEPRVRPPNHVSEHSHPGCAAGGRPDRMGFCGQDDRKPSTRGTPIFRLAARRTTHDFGSHSEPRRRIKSKSWANQGVGHSLLPGTACLQFVFRGESCGVLMDAGPFSAPLDGVDAMQPRYKTRNLFLSSLSC